KPRWIFLKIHTDVGIVGLGEPLLEGRALTIQTAIKEIEPYLIGKDPRNIVHHWQDRKSTRLNSSHVKISYAVFCLKKKITKKLDQISNYCPDSTGLDNYDSLISFFLSSITNNY